MKTLNRAAAMAGTALLCAGAAQAATDIHIGMLNVPSWDANGDPDNVDVVADLAAAAGLPSGSPVSVIGIGWDVELRTVNPSWLSELALSLGDADTVPFLVQLRPAVGDDLPGSNVYSSGGVVDLVSIGLDFTCTQGNLALEWFEIFDDVSDEIDGYWTGRVTVRIAEMSQAIPLPGPAGMGLAGIGLLAGVRRRR